MKTLSKILVPILIVIFIMSNVGTANIKPEPPKKEFTFAISIYAGWMPHYYSEVNGILKKYADREGIKITFKRMDYIPSVEAFVTQQVDACVMTNMEMLDMPAAAGIDCDVIVQGDYSNGNDGVCIRDVTSTAGQDIYLAQGTVSEYLFERAIQLKKIPANYNQIVNVSDAAIEAGFRENKNQHVVVTWNPMLIHLQQLPGIKTVFTSAEIPGEIMDLLVVTHEVAVKYPEVCRALVGAWYEIMNIMTQRGPVSEKALKIMAKEAGSDLAELKSQLSTTLMYYTPQDAYDYMTSNEIKYKMDLVRNFCFKHKLLGENTPSVDYVGIQYPDGSVQGNPKNVKMRFNATFTKLVIDGKIPVK
jgi:NitT/TauT family transport system substrate-binding protein